MRINNLFLLISMSLLIISCSDLPVDIPEEVGDLVKDQDSGRYWVYCTEQDRKNNKKSFSGDEEDLCLRKKLTIGSYELSLKATIVDMNAEGDDEIGYNELIIKKKKKIIEKIRLEGKRTPFYFTTGFAKIREGIYTTDLNNDGIIEFALVHYGTDRNRYTKAQIYSMQDDGKIILYGKGTYNKDLGKHVMFGCPDCHTINLDACKSCY